MEQGKRLEECLCVRRSIRQFTDQPVERTIIQTLLEMAILAPSASNRQPWGCIILDDPVLVQKIRAFSPGIGGNPPCLIVFCLDSQRLPVMRNGTIDRTCGIIDLAMAAENMMLAATSHGLGTCVIKSYHPQIVKKILELPEQICPEFIVTLGYPKWKVPMPKRRSLEEISSYNLEVSHEHGRDL